MKFHQKFVAHGLSLLISAVAAMGLLSASAQARDAQPTQFAFVPISGTLFEASEVVLFWGRAQVSSKLILDPVFNAPSLQLTVDFSDVSGLGLGTLKKYVIPTPEIVQRRLGANHTLQVSFPYVEPGMSLLTARSAVANITLVIDVNTGAILSAIGNVAALKS
jgi:hypothetical protein